MRFLVVGQGGREHGLVRALRMASDSIEIHAVPGSAGMSSEAVCHAFSPSDRTAWENLLKKYAFDCVIVGPEVPLAEGLADFLRLKGIATVGPNQAAARLESSKIFSKEFMTEAGIPTAKFRVVESTVECLAALAEMEPPYVLKADGLAAGKGVFICATKEELEHAAESLFKDRSLGDAGRKAVLEQFQPGYEVSYLVLTDGQSFQPLPVSQDHKRLGDGDKGPNTGGMGVVCPVPIDVILRDRIHKEIVEPTLSGLVKQGLPYRGIIYFGIMVTPTGPSLLEYNVRFGDPEAQAILPLLDGSWADVFLKLAHGELAPLHWKNMSSACVVMAAPGYPDAPTETPIDGEIFANTDHSYFLHAGTRNVEGRWLTGGGRVINAVGLGHSLKEAVIAAYAQAKKLRWTGLQMRKDIGKAFLTSRG